MSGHTPGPWHVVDGGRHWNNPEIKNFRIRDGITSEHGYDVAWSEAGELVVEHVYEEADARLIAAAPDLLDALFDARKQLEAYEEALNGEGYNSPRINAALAKATGEQP